MEEPEPYYLALDPGTHTGWALWDKDGKFLEMGTTHSDTQLHEKLASLPITIKVVVIEDFQLWHHKAQQQAGSRMPAPKTIGAVETFARLWGARIVKQPSNIKPIAERMTGVSTKGKQKSQTHVLDAYNHGEYYLIKNKVKEIRI